MFPQKTSHAKLSILPKKELSGQFSKWRTGNKKSTITGLIKTKVQRGGPKT